MVKEVLQGEKNDIWQKLGSQEGKMADCYIPKPQQQLTSPKKEDTGDPKLHPEGPITSKNQTSFWINKERSN
jgi:hypothetical protein